MDVRHRKPILGFGPIGWLALATLVAILTALARGWDPVYTAALILWHVGGGNWEGWWYLWLRLWWQPCQAWDGLTFGLWGLLYTAVALFIYPRRLPVLPIVLLVLAVLIEGFSFRLAPPWVAAHLYVNDYILFGSAAALCETATIFWLTRRWWCAAMPLVALIWRNIAQYGIFQHPDPWAVLAFHCLTAIPLLLWAVSARLKPAPVEKPCPHCRYDLTGIPSGKPCPECGRASEPA